MAKRVVSKSSKAANNSRNLLVFTVLGAIALCFFALFLVDASTTTNTDLRSQASEQSSTAYPLYMLRNDLGKLLLTTRRSELASAVKVYKFQYIGVAFSVFTAQVPETLPVYRLDNKKNYLYTLDEQEKEKALQRGYTLDGVAFYAYKPSSTTGIPVYRWYNREKDLHDYTLGKMNGRKGFELEGEALRIPSGR